MKPTQALILQLRDELGNPLLLAGIYFDLLFFIQGQDCYGFRFGPTDGQGELRITYRDVETKRALEAKFYLMDYNTPLDDCDDRLKIQIPSADKLRKAYEWQAKWLDGGASPEAEGWLKSANPKLGGKEVAAELNGDETVVIVRIN
jgi:hypothetical protein